MARFDSSPGKADSPDPANPPKTGKSAEKRKRARLIAGAGIVAVVAATAVLVPIALGNPTPAPPAASSPAQSRTGVSPCRGGPPGHLLRAAGSAGRVAAGKG